MKTLIAAAALAAAWTGTPATAQASRHIATADLDLSRPADVHRLDARIAAAARRVCADRSSTLYGSYAAARSCVRATRRTAAVQRDAAVAAAALGGVTLANR